jgi:5-methylcytosine-specific restriction enzyme A
VRLKLWSSNPLCAKCGRLTQFPRGFELDHILPLFKGGDDSEENLQILCSGTNGCHAKKSADDMGVRFKPEIGLDGWPV